MRLSGLKIGFWPINIENQYLANMKNVFSELGTVSKLPSMKDFLKNPIRIYRQRFDLVVISWYENILISKNGKLSFKGVFDYFKFIFFLKIISKKSIYIRHNVYPHGTSKKHAKLCRKIIDISEGFYSSVIVHSGHMASEKRFYVPHPLYKLPENEDKNIAFHNEPFFLIFGQILPYKKIEDVIDVLPDSCNLIIAGVCKDANYLKLLKEKSYNKGNIIINPEFLTDEDAAQLVSRATAVIINHSDEDMIVSGTYFFAISLGVPILCVNSGFFNWMNSELSTSGLYIFNTVDEMSFALKNFKQINSTDEVKSFARNNFGDAIVRENVLKVLRILK